TMDKVRRFLCFPLELLLALFQKIQPGFPHVPEDLEGSRRFLQDQMLPYLFDLIVMDAQCQYLQIQVCQCKRKILPLPDHPLPYDFRIRLIQEWPYSFQQIDETLVNRGAGIDHSLTEYGNGRFRIQRISKFRFP